jgi:hypothetical protein
VCRYELPRAIGLLWLGLLHSDVCCIVHAFFVIHSLQQATSQGSKNQAIMYALVTWLPRQECNMLFWDRRKYSLASVSVSTHMYVACSQADQINTAMTIAPCKTNHDSSD